MYGHRYFMNLPRYVENKVHINCQIMLITIYMNEQ